MPFRQRDQERPGTAPVFFKARVQSIGFGVVELQLVILLTGILTVFGSKW